MRDFGPDGGATPVPDRNVYWATLAGAEDRAVAGFDLGRSVPFGFLAMKLFRLIGARAAKAQCRP
jgi:hypothetical protein